MFKRIRPDSGARRIIIDYGLIALIAIALAIAVQVFGVMVGATIGYQVQIFSNMNLDFALGLVGRACMADRA